MANVSNFLSGVKILDLSQYISGPFATLMFTDMGADVIKIEPPHGDEMINMGPRDVDNEPIFYHALNAGKSLVRLDLKSEDGRARMLELLGDADILIEGFRPGVMARLNLDYSSIKAAHPSLIYCSISGYGPTGSLSQVAGHDGNFLAASGILDRNGDGKPFFFDPPIADMSGALFAAVAILGALYARGRTGEGTHIELGLADTLMPLQLMQVAEWSANATVPTRRSTYLNGAAAYYNIYETANERHIMLGAVEPKFWRNFCVAAQRRDWIPRHSDPLPHDTLISEIAAFFSMLTTAQIATQFDGVECCLTPVLNLGEALLSDSVCARGLVRTTNGTMQTLFPATFDGETTRPREKIRADRAA